MIRNKFRFNILNSITPSEGIHILDFITRILEYQFEEGELNFALPSIAVSKYRELPVSEAAFEEGVYESIVDNYFAKKGEIIMSLFHHRDLLEGEPERTDITYQFRQDLAFEHIREFSYNGLVLRKEFLDEYYLPKLKKDFDIYCPEGKYTFMEFILRTKRIPLALHTIGTSVDYSLLNILKPTSVLDFKYSISCLRNQYGTNNDNIWDHYKSIVEDLTEFQTQQINELIGLLIEQKKSKSFDKLLTEDFSILENLKLQLLEKNLRSKIEFMSFEEDINEIFGLQEIVSFISESYEDNFIDYNEIDDLENHSLPQENIISRFILERETVDESEQYREIYNEKVTDIREYLQEHEDDIENYPEHDTEDEEEFERNNEFDDVYGSDHDDIPDYISDEDENLQVQFEDQDDPWSVFD